MKTLLLPLIGILSFSTASLGADEGMPSMPKIAPKKTYPVQSVGQGESLLEDRGYGDQESSVRMMYLMMVGGSGYEGMEMTQASDGVPIPAEGQTATYDVQTQITPDPPHVGTHLLNVTVQAKNTKKPAQGLKITALVYMTSMDMGTSEPKVKEISPGKYQAKVNFSMAGPWAVKLSLPEAGEKIVTFEVK